MIYKIALCDLSHIEIDSFGKMGLIKTASGRVFVEPNSDKAKIIEAEIKKHPTALFFRAKAIKADEPNSNGDYFSSEELVKSYKTFEGVPFFTNHDNQNIENARGKIIFAEWIPEEKSIYTIAFVDREAFPHICRSIEEEYTTGVSMGASVDYSICNICGNRAEKTEDYCMHIREKKGRKFSGKAKNVITGEIKEFKNEPVFEYNYGIKFIELSAVVDPACSSCHIEGIIPNDEYVKKIANFQNTLFMIKTSAIEKNAGQEEVTQLNSVLETLEKIAINLIQNRQQVEVEFASDLVGILSDLQKFVDELVGAGYGNVQNIPGIAQTQPQQPAETPPTSTPPPNVMPVAEEKPIETMSPGAGSISGSPTKPLVKAPQLPITSPAKPRAFDVLRLVKVSNALKDLSEKMYHTEETDMAKRRTVAERIEQKKMATEILSNSWKEKQQFLEYIIKVPSIQNNYNKLSVRKRDDTFIIVAEEKSKTPNLGVNHTWTYENLSEEERRMIKESPKEAAQYLLNTFSNNLKNQKEGVSKMSDRIKEAGAKSVNKSPEVITEAQLEQQKDLYHPRTSVEQEVITEKQLDNKDIEQEVITEAQLEAKTNKLNPRTQEEKDVITQKQLETTDGVSPRKNEDSDVITQKQLDENRVNAEQEVITEKQLDSVSAPWERAAGRNPSMFKSAGDHMSSVIDAIADASIITGCTPQESCKIAGSLIGSTKDRYELANAILDKSDEEDVDYAQRLSYWSKKNIKVAGTGSKEIAETIVRKLRKVVADTTINPEVVLDAIDVISEDNSGIEAISNRIDAKLAEKKEEKVRASVKSELRNALKGKESREEERKEIIASVEKEDQKITREAERAIWEKKIENVDKKPDRMIETSFEEIGCSKKDPNFRKAVKSFVRGALASRNIKLAAITNVTIDGDTISIAVQTNEGDESVEIPVDSGKIDVNDSEVVPEGDLAGEGLENTLPPQGTAEPSIAAGPVASDSSKMSKKAQAPMGGGIPQAPGEVAGGPGAPEAGLPGATPVDEEAVESLTAPGTDTEDLSDEIPTAGEQQMPYAICPECGSSDVDIQKEDGGNVKGNCNNCGAGYEALVKKEVEFIITKPSGKGEAGEVELPEVPALPVAAQTKLDKNVLVRIASNKEKYGHVCPACGMNQCKIASESEGHIEYKCPACGTDIEKDIIVNVNNPEESYQRVAWTIIPKVGDCENCKKEAEKFASLIKIEKMIKNASNGTTPFPMANCVEKIARIYGGNSVSTFGHCKGKPLADCVCKQLEKLGMSKVRHLEKLAATYMQKDPMDECIEDFGKKGYNIKEAKTLCGCLKKKFASEIDDNPFIQAFEDDVKTGKEKILTAQDLKTINDFVEGPVDDEAVAIEESDVDLADVGFENETAIPEEKVTIEVSKETAQELADAATEASEEVEVEVEEVTEVSEVPEVVEGVSETIEQVPANEGLEEKEMALSMQTHKLRRVGEKVVQIAATPKKVEDIEGNVDAGVPRAKATMGKEGPDNIDVPMAKPSVPRANAEMGKEGPDNINKPANLPDVAVDNAYMGGEKAVQSNMPAINNEIKGTVIAGDAKTKKQAKQLKEVDTVEKDVDAGVPRAKATMGNEGTDNIDVPMAKPSVPRANAEMGKEGPDNINPKTTGPDVPVDDAYMGDEKNVQKDMPPINDEYLKQVQQKKEVQLERIASARRQKASEVAYKLLASSRITEEAYDDVVEALSNFEIDKIASKAEVMYPRIKLSSSTDRDVHAGPAIVMESKPLAKSEDTLTNKLASAFTIGNKGFDEALTRYGEK